ncbi:MAG: family transporter protein [Verrucomicrobiales bacterium]|nr:family transporter protein [Verrucomicrobiales bacterium]
MVSAGAAFLICFWMLVVLTEGAWRTSTMAGQQLFRILFGFAFAYVLGAGMRATASSLSRERKDGTLGLLFLTDLKGYDIVFGKLAGTALDVFYSTVAILPVLAIPILMGGVTAQDFALSTLVLLATLFFSLTAGMLASSFSRDERESLNTAFLIVLVFVLVLPVTVSVVNLSSVKLPAFLTMASPGMLAFAAATNATGEFWKALLGVHALSWIFLLASNRFVARVWQDKPRSGWRLAWQEWKRTFTLGNPEVRRRLRRVLLSRNPIHWLGSRERQHKWNDWNYLAGMLAVLVYALVLERSFFSISTLPLLYITTAILKYWVASAASHSFAAGRSNGTLELILSTPLEMTEILHGHWLSLLHQFRYPFVAFAGFETIVMVAGAIQMPKNGEGVHAWIFAHVANILLLMADSYTLVWAGLWQAMIKKSPQAATSAAVARVLILPWLGLGALMMFCLPMIAASAGMAIIAPWLLMGVVVDIVITQSSKGRLEREMRSAASEQWLTADQDKGWRGAVASAE